MSNCWVYLCDENIYSAKLYNFQRFISRSLIFLDLTFGVDEYFIVNFSLKTSLIKIFISGINESNEEKLKELLLLKGFGKSTNNYYTNSEVWFRAVLIAVPICGLVVLLILIVVAVKMLKSDIPPDGFTSAKLMWVSIKSDNRSVVGLH